MTSHHPAGAAKPAPTDWAGTCGSARPRSRHRFRVRAHNSPAPTTTSKGGGGFLDYLLELPDRGKELDRCLPVRIAAEIGVLLAVVLEVLERLMV